MVEKVKALCDAIDTLNSLPDCENTAARLAELSEMLLAECKQMVEPPVTQISPSAYVAGNDIETGDPLVFIGDRVYATAARPAKPESNEGFHTLVPLTPTYSEKAAEDIFPTKSTAHDLARATLLREMGEINGDVPSGQKIYPDLGLPRLP